MKTNFIDMNAISFEEQETSINWLHNEEFATICTSEKKTMSKCEEKGYECISQTVSKNHPDKVLVATYRVPKNMIQFATLLK